MIDESFQLTLLTGFKNHQKYTIHITLAYILRKLTQEEINNLLKVNNNLLNEFVKKFPKIVLKNPTVCTFENMLEFKSINSSILELIEKLNDDVESTFKKKGKGSKIRAEIFDNRINLIIPYMYDNQLTGFEKILYNIIEMMYLLLKKFCETDSSLTEAKLESFLNLYFKGTDEKRPLLFLNIIDKLVCFDKIIVGVQNRR